MVAMELSWLDPKEPDRRHLAGAVTVLEAARAVDTPLMFSPLTTSYAYRLRSGWDGEPPITAVYQDERGRVVGLLDIWLPERDNTHTGGLHVVVDPLVRRKGLGRRLFEAGIERIRSEGRRVVLADSYGAAGIGFLDVMGFERAAETVYRRQDLTSVDWSRLDREHEQASQKAADYELLRFTS